MLPEEKARLEIDKKLIDAGWEVVDRDEYSPAVSAMAVREGLLKGNKEGVVLSWVILRRHNVNYELKIKSLKIGIWKRN